MNMAHLGTQVYEANFGYHYTRDTSKGEIRDFILLADENYSLDIGNAFSNRSVALVCNGDVTQKGRLIDSHDDVVRLNVPYSWRGDGEHDGERFTHWMGLPKNEISNPLDLPMKPLDFRPDWLKTKILSAEKFYALSHHHLQRGFFDAFSSLGLLSKLTICWSCPIFLGHIERTAYGRDQHLMAWMTNRKYLDCGYGGWHGWEVLLTGSRAVLFICVSRPKVLNIFGMRFYEQSERRPWDMHDVDLNREFVYKVAHHARASGIEVNFI